MNSVWEIRNVKESKSRASSYCIDFFLFFFPTRSFKVSASKRKKMNKKKKNVMT